MNLSTNKARAEALWLRAAKREEQGKMRAAFRLMLAAAKLGSISAQTNVGNYYDDGRGVRRSRATALYWYKRAYKRGDHCAAHNIGVVWRNEGNLRRSLYWFTRAVKMGDEESNLDIGKHFLNDEHNPKKAIPYLKRVKPTGWVTEAGAEEAQRLLRQALKQARKSR